MRKKIKSADIVWFVSELDATRISSDEKVGIKQITAAFGKEVWQHSVIVFTNADKVEPEKYASTLRTRSSLIRKAIESHGLSNAAQDIPVVAVTNKNKVTPDGTPWIGELYAQSFFRMRATGGLRFLLATQAATSVGANGKKKARIPLNDRQEALIYKRLMKDVAEYAGYGEEIGEFLAGKAGKKVGKMVGSLIGAAKHFFTGWW